jgi:hypothetical protein
LGEGAEWRHSRPVLPYPDSKSNVIGSSTASSRCSRGVAGDRDRGRRRTPRRPGATSTGGGSVSDAMYAIGQARAMRVIDAARGAVEGSLAYLCTGGNVHEDTLAVNAGRGAVVAAVCMALMGPLESTLTSRSYGPARRMLASAGRKALAPAAAAAGAVAVVSGGMLMCRGQETVARALSTVTRRLLRKLQKKIPSAPILWTLIVLAVTRMLVVKTRVNELQDKGAGMARLFMAAIMRKAQQHEHANS